MEKMFEVALREKYRYNTSAGEITVEQLWDLPLTGKLSLDSVAMGIDAEIQKTPAKSFVNNSRDSQRSTNEAKLAIVVYIIEVKQAEKNAAIARMEKSSKLSAIDKAIALKEQEALLSGSLEDLKKRREELSD